jgi:hypothetical protein
MHGQLSQNVFRSLFRKCSSEIRGTQAYKSEENCCFLLRHKFAGESFILGCRENRMSRDEVEYIKTALHPSNLNETRKGCVSEKILDGVRNIVSPTVSAALGRIYITYRTLRFLLHFTSRNTTVLVVHSPTLKSKT